MCIPGSSIRLRNGAHGLQGTGHQKAQEECCLWACASVESRPPGLEEVRLLASISLDELERRISSRSKEDVSHSHEEVPEEYPDPLKDPHKIVSLDWTGSYGACPSFRAILEIVLAPEVVSSGHKMYNIWMGNCTVKEFYVSLQDFWHQ